MELYQLKTFVVVAEEKHLTRASEQLHTSQPSVSAHIKALEEELETQLFLRTPKGMTLTEAGKRLHAKARLVLSSAEELRREARKMGDELVGEVCMGLNTDAEFLRIVPLLTALSEVHPKITLQLMQGATTSVLDALRTGRQDAGFIFDKPRSADILGVRLASTQFFLAVPDIWQEHIAGGLESLIQLPWISDPGDNPVRRMVESFFTAHGDTPRDVMEVDGDEVIQVLVAAGKGVALLRENELRAANRIGRRVHAVPFDGLTIDLYFVCRKVQEQDPVMRAVIEQVRRVWGVG